MRLSLTLALTAVMVLTACGSMRESRLNPLNWFGGSREAQADEFGIPATLEARPLVDQVLSMSIEQTPYGAIVRATGLSPNQGHYDAELVARPLDENLELLASSSYSSFPVCRGGLDDILGIVS